MDRKDISTELWREYSWRDPVSGQEITHRIFAPQALWVGVTTHRVLDSDGIVHCIPNVGYFGCVLRWQNRDPDNPVNF